MSKYHDDTTIASDPGRINLSDEKLRRFHPELYSRTLRYVGFLRARWPYRFIREAAGWREMIAEHIRLGDSRAALVVSVDPVIVAAYTDELDCVALLKFETWVAQEYKLRSGDRLLTVNTYTRPGATPRAPDLTVGPKECKRYIDFWPIIADFLTDDAQRVNQRKAAIAEAEWERTQLMADKLITHPKASPRDGRPLYTITPGEVIAQKPLNQ